MLQWVKPLPVMLATHSTVLVRVLTALPLTLLPANAPRKAQQVTQVLESLSPMWEDEAFGSDF